MTDRTLASLVVVSLATLGMAAAIPTASAQSATVVIAPSAPPAPRVETIPPPPPAEAHVMSWKPGHWAWNGTTWDWEEGHYVQRPVPTAIWEPGHWSAGNGGYVWIDGHWRS